MQKPPTNEDRKPRFPAFLVHFERGFCSPNLNFRLQAEAGEDRRPRPAPPIAPSSPEHWKPVLHELCPRSPHPPCSPDRPPPRPSLAPPSSPPRPSLLLLSPTSPTPSQTLCSPSLRSSFPPPSFLQTELSHFFKVPFLKKNSRLWESFKKGQRSPLPPFI